jgi:hypothetical protein
MKGNLTNTLITIKFFLLSMLLLSVLMSLLVGWVVFKVIVAIPKNEGEPLKVAEIKSLSEDVQRIYADCLSKEDWSKVVKTEVKMKMDQCVLVASQTDSYKKLRQVYEINVLPSQN